MIRHTRRRWRQTLRQAAVVQPVVLPAVQLPLRKLRNSWPGCWTPGGLPGPLWLRPASRASLRGPSLDAMAGWHRHVSTERGKRKNKKIAPIDRCSPRTSLFGAPHAGLESAARVGHESGLETSRGERKDIRRQKRHSFPARHEKSCTKRGKRIRKSGAIRTGNQPIGAFSHQSRSPN